MKWINILSLISALILLVYPFILSASAAISIPFLNIGGIGGFIYALFGLFVLYGTILNFKRRSGLAGSLLVLLFSILSFLFGFGLGVPTFDWTQIYLGIGVVLGILAGSASVYKAEPYTRIPVPKP